MAVSSITSRHWIWVVALIATGLAVLAWRQPAPLHSAPGPVLPPEEINAIITDKLRFYNDQVPEIRFVHLAGGEDWHGDLVAVMTLLGTEAIVRDYEHPSELREELVSATIQRLRQMLQYDIVSASLFQVGMDSVVGRPHLCVITLNPDAFVASDRDATRYMLDISNDVMAKVHPKRYLDQRDHLEFTLDHEAFHCLDSLRHGGAPITHRLLGGEYNLFKRESAADAYAMAVHIKEHGRVTNYARNLVHLRALWLFTDSPNRCTFESVREVLRLRRADLTGLSMEQLIALAVQIRDDNVRNYEQYLRQRAAALAAAEVLGLAPTLYGDAWLALRDIDNDATLVASLVNRYRYYYEQLFTGIDIPLQAPQLTEVLQR